MSLNSSVQMSVFFPSIQLLGLEMLLHYFQGPDVVATAAKNKFILSLGKRQSNTVLYNEVEQSFGTVVTLTGTVSP